MLIRAATVEDFEVWDKLRRELWPDSDAAENNAFFQAYLQRLDKNSIFLAADANNQTIGFVEVSISTEYVEGCDTERVGYLEGLFVSPQFRRRGIANWLMRTAENWAREQHCREFASDAELENTVSHQTHLRFGFEEVSRNVHFKKSLE